jgi:TatD DNase family protein
VNFVTSRSLDATLPALDVHAHVDPTVTPAQLASLGGAIVFAVTRTLVEAAQVVNRTDDRILWGVGVHPGRKDALDAFESSKLFELATQLDFVGEIGLDRRLRDSRALEALSVGILAAQQNGRLCSVHSTGRHREVVEVAATDGRGVILHWFTGSAKLIETAAAAGCYFSVNAAMTDAQIAALPVERLLPETDFPFTRKSGSSQPGDVAVLEQRCSALLDRGPDEIRQMWYRNLRAAWLDVAGDLSTTPAVLRRPFIAA